MGSTHQEKHPSTQQTHIQFKQMIKVSQISSPQAFYQFLDRLGQGYYAEVFKVRSLCTGDFRVIKKVEKSKSPTIGRHLTNQFQILREMDHPNIIKMFEMFEDDKYFYIITQFLQGRDVYEQLQQKKVISQEEAFNIFYQILLAITYLHENKVMHRDIKLENIIYDKKSKSIKVIDFGSSLKFESYAPKERRCTGTIHYLAPEVINKYYNNKCDIWSLGILLYVLLSGNAPFLAKQHDQIMKNILKEPLSFDKPIWKQRSPEAKNLISKLLQRNFEKRIQASKIQSEPWILKFKSQRIISKPQKELIINSLQNMERFIRIKVSQIQIGILLFMINFILNINNEYGMMKIFNTIDKKQDGKIDSSQIKMALMDYLGYPAKRAEEICQQFLQKIDFDHNGHVSYSQFVLASTNLKEVLKDENLQKTFQYIDTDNSDGISLTELKNRLGDHITQAKYILLLKEFSKNKQGQINRKSFFQIMKNILKCY